MVHDLGGDIVVVAMNVFYWLLFPNLSFEFSGKAFEFSKLII